MVIVIPANGGCVFKGVGSNRRLAVLQEFHPQVWVGKAGKCVCADSGHVLLKDDEPSDIQLIENYYPPILYKVTEEDTKESLQAEGYELSKEDIEPGDIIMLTKIEGKKHIVKPLESLDDISKMYFMDKLDIIQRNNLKTEKLFIGQILWI